MSRAKIAAIVAFAIAVTALAVGVYHFVLASGDEDRPPIIVRSGSVYLEDGDPQDAAHWKEWKAQGNPRRWKPDHSGGAKVIAYSVSIANADSGMPATPCPALPIVGTTVAVEYTVLSTHTASVITIGRDAAGSNQDPVIDAPADLTSSPGAGSTPPRLTYDPGAGWISKVTVSLSSGLSTIEQSCSFNQPAAQQPGRAVITIKPLR
jgi:hypothetical protein